VSRSPSASAQPTLQSSVFRFGGTFQVAFKPDGYDNAAVSMNMFDITQTPVYRAVQVIENEAKRYGLSVVETQICGTLPQEALVNCAEYYLKLVDFDYKQIIENNILAIK